MGAIGVGHAAGGSHGHDAHGHAGHGHAGHAHGAAHGHAAGHHGADTAHHAPAAHGQTHAHTESTYGELASRAAWSLLSPRVVFSFLVGFGAAGMLLGAFLGGALLLVAALVGGVAFERFLVAPLWNFLFRFESRTAATLESALLDEGQAVSGFDAGGRGLIALELDGQVVQVLGILRADERAAGVRVRAGDRVRVEDVDATRNQCVVTRIG